MSDKLICRAFACSGTKLIDAHILPRAFAKMMRGAGPNISVSESYSGPASAQLGVYDGNILCSECDNKLGAFDKYAVEVCRRFSREHKRISPSEFEMDNVDGDLFAKFVLAVIWRSSISSRDEISDVHLGKYEILARDVLFGEKPLATISGFKVLVQRYFSPVLDPAGLCTLPARAKLLDWNTYGFALNGFRIIAVIDNKPIPMDWHRFVLNGNAVLRGTFQKLEDTSEFSAMRNYVVAEARRQGKAPWELRR